MNQLEILKEALLQLTGKYPIDLYKGTVPSYVRLQRFLSLEQFLKNEKVTITKLGMSILQNSSIALDDVQKVINTVIREHFQLDCANAKPAQE